MKRSEVVTVRRACGVGDSPPGGKRRNRRVCRVRACVARRCKTACAATAALVRQLAMGRVAGDTLQRWC